MKALETLRTKVDSKSWTNPIADEDVEVIEHALFAASILTAQVRAWNEIHQMIPQLFKSIIDSFNDTIVFADDPERDSE